MRKSVLLSLMWMLSAAGFCDSLHFTLHGDPHEWVSQGQDWDILYSGENTSPLLAMLSQSSGVGPDFLELLAIPADPATTPFLLADFGTNQLGVPLTTGALGEAQRASFAGFGHPGLDIAFESRGNNELTGSFTIHSIGYHPDNGNWILDNFDASFQQFNEGGPLSCWGTIIYQATPEPSPLLVLAGLGPLLLLRGRRT